MPGSRILFRTTGNARIGWGHVMRSMALAARFREASWHVRFELVDSDPEIRSRVSREFPVSSETGKTPEWTVLDSYRWGERERKRVVEGGSRLLCIDDLAKGPVTADVILNSSGGVRRSDYRCPERTRLLLGPRYCPLRRPFRKPPRPRPVRARGRRLLLAFGGRDPLDLTRRVKRTLGRTFDCRILRGVDAAGAARMMDRADLAIAAAGSTCWELASRGVPVLAIVTAFNQRRVAETAVRLGFGSSLGWYNRLSNRRLHESVDALAGNPRLRARMSRCGRNAVDGKGVDRVFEVIRWWRR